MRLALLQGIVVFDCITSSLPHARR